MKNPRGEKPESFFLFSRENVLVLWMLGNNFIVVFLLMNWKLTDHKVCVCGLINFYLSETS